MWRLSIYLQECNCHVCDFNSWHVLRPSRVTLTAPGVLQYSLMPDFKDRDHLPSVGKFQAVVWYFCWSSNAQDLVSIWAFSFTCKKISTHLWPLSAFKFCLISFENFQNQEWTHCLLFVSAEKHSPAAGITNYYTVIHGMDFIHTVAAVLWQKLKCCGAILLRLMKKTRGVWKMISIPPLFKSSTA